MEIIPVLDIRNGIVVHGKSGERETYKPLVSILTQSQEPVTVAKDLCAKLKVNSIYVADLDAIENNNNNIDEMVRMSKMVKGKILLDAGISKVERVEELMDCNNIHAVIGTETISTIGEIEKLAHWGSDKLTISLDFYNNRLVSKCLELSKWDLSQTFNYLIARGFYDFILLDLDAVGTKRGIDTKRIEFILSLYPQVRLLVGGGVSNTNDLLTLKKAGVSGVLVGTALHTGAVTMEDVMAVMSNDM